MPRECSPRRCRWPSAARPTSATRARLLAEVLESQANVLVATGRRAEAIATLERLLGATGLRAASDSPDGPFATLARAARERLATLAAQPATAPPALD